MQHQQPKWLVTDKKGKVVPHNCSHRARATMKLWIDSHESGTCSLRIVRLHRSFAYTHRKGVCGPN